MYIEKIGEQKYFFKSNPRLLNTYLGVSKLTLSLLFLELLHGTNVVKCEPRNYFTNSNLGLLGAITWSISKDVNKP